MWTFVHYCCKSFLTLVPTEPKLFTVVIDNEFWFNQHLLKRFEYKMLNLFFVILNFVENDFCYNDFCSINVFSNDFCSSNFCSKVYYCSSNFCSINVFLTTFVQTTFIQTTFAPTNFCINNFWLNNCCLNNFCLNNFCLNNFCSNNFCSNNFCSNNLCLNNFCLKIFYYIDICFCSKQFMFYMEMLIHPKNVSRFVRFGSRVKNPPCCRVNRPNGHHRLVAGFDQEAVTWHDRKLGQHSQYRNFFGPNKLECFVTLGWKSPPEPTL